LKKDQPYRKKYQVAFGYKSDIPNLHTDDLFQAEAVYKEYQHRGIKCSIGILTHEKKDSTSINYYPLEQDVDRRIKCCECGERLKPGEKAVIADITEQVDDYPRREIHVHNHGHVMCAKCDKKITDRDKEFHRVVKIVVSDDEARHFSHGERSRFSYSAANWDLDQMMKGRFSNFRFMQITESWQHETKHGLVHNVFKVKIKGLGHQFDELQDYLKPVTKKETK